MQTHFKTLFLLFCLILPALLFGLGERPVYKIQEVRIAETAREMLESGDWVVPRFNGELRLQKPPLPYWVTAASYSVAGVDATATRLPAVLAALFLVCLIWRWSGRELGAETAANSAIVLIVSFLGLRYFRSGEADALLLLFISAACKLGFDIIRGQRDQFRRVLFGLLLGLGFLSKGPAGLLIPLLTLLGMAFAEGRGSGGGKNFAALFSISGVAAMLLAAFGWYLWIFWSMPDAAESFFGRQIDETFISGNHAKPLWWYLANLPQFFAPWSILILPAGWMAYQARRETPPLLCFAWIWLAVVFVLLTVTINKQTQYALLFAPPLAIILGHYLAAAAGGFLKLNRALFILLCLAGIVGLGFMLYRFGVSSLWWLALPALPLLLARLLAVRSPSWPILLAAGLVTMAFLFGETTLSKEPRKVAAETLMPEAAGKSPLLQSEARPGRGEFSFYARKVVPPVDAEELPKLLEAHSEIWLVGENVPVPEYASATVVKQVGELQLVRLSTK